MKTAKSKFHQNISFIALFILLSNDSRKYVDHGMQAIFLVNMKITSMEFGKVPNKLCPMIVIHRLTICFMV